MQETQLGGITTAVSANRGVVVLNANSKPVLVRREAHVGEVGLVTMLSALEPLAAGEVRVGGRALLEGGTGVVQRPRDISADVARKRAIERDAEGTVDVVTDQTVDGAFSAMLVLVRGWLAREELEPFHFIAVDHGLVLAIPTAENQVVVGNSVVFRKDSSCTMEHTRERGALIEGRGSGGSGKGGDGGEGERNLHRGEGTRREGI